MEKKKRTRRTNLVLLEDLGVNWFIVWLEYFLHSRILIYTENKHRIICIPHWNIADKGPSLNCGQF